MLQLFLICFSKVTIFSFEQLSLLCEKYGTNFLRTYLFYNLELALSQEKILFS
ncbi:hypothetical protein HMPREF9093_00277 [Fusobacterium sp. oral taxon 370 str. F0437]|nr:hypothetical protein HMPREF9093_00277 [Fusobacterium sp. oral taxon 370 str. F0437]